LLPTRQIRALSAAVDQRDSKLEEEYAEERRWAAALHKETIPRGLAKVRFDRSSGKGGQHVNTTSSKATCTWPLSTMLSHVPKILHPALRSSNYYAHSSDSLVIQAQTSRKQHENENECHERLYQLLRDISKRLIPGETSKEQHAKVHQMQKAENTARLRMKKQHSDKKKSRGSGGRGGDY